MLEALRTRNLSFIQKTLQEDWRLRFSSVTQVQSIISELMEITRSNDISYVRLAIDVTGKLLNFHFNTTTNEQQLVSGIQQQFTKMLLVFVRSNESDKTVILDSVAHIRTLIRYNALEQFQLIKQIFQQYEKQSTLLIALMALMPQLYAHALLQNQVAATEIPRFMEQVQKDLTVLDWLSPLTNGFMHLYDVSGLTLLDSTGYFDRQQEVFLLQMVGCYGIQYAKADAFQAENGQLDSLNVVLQLKERGLLDRFNLLLKPVIEVLNSNPNNFDSLQILASACQYDSQVFDLLTQYFMKVKVTNFSVYENLHEIASYLMVKVTGIQSVKIFQHLLTFDMLNNCNLQTQNYIARSFYGLLLQKDQLELDSQFVSQLLIYLCNCLSSLFISRESAAFTKIINQYKQGGAAGQVSQLWQILAWQPPASLQKMYKSLLVQICFSVFMFVRVFENEVVKYIEHLLSVVYELKICSNISVFRFIGQEILYVLYCQLFVEQPADSSFLDTIPGPQDGEYLQHMIKLFQSCLSFQKCQDAALKKQMFQLLQSGVQDPQWRNRQQVYKQLQRVNPEVLHCVVQPGFPFYNEKDIVADIQTPMSEQFQPSHMQQATDQVQQVRQDFLNFLDQQFLTAFGTPFIQSSVPLAQLVPNLNLQMFQKQFEENKNNYIIECGQSVDGLGFSTEVAKAIGLVTNLAELVAQLQYSETKVFRRSYCWVAEYCIQAFDFALFLQKQLAILSTASGRRQRELELQQLQAKQDTVFKQFKGLAEDFFT